MNTSPAHFDGHIPEEQRELYRAVALVYRACRRDSLPEYLCHYASLGAVMFLRPEELSREEAELRANLILAQVSGKWPEWLISKKK